MGRYLIVGEISNAGKLWVVDDSSLEVLSTIDVTQDDDMTGVVYLPTIDRYILNDRFGRIFSYSLANGTLTQQHRLTESSTSFDDLTYDSVRDRLITTGQRTGGSTQYMYEYSYSVASGFRRTLRDTVPSQTGLGVNFSYSPRGLAYIPGDSPKLHVYNSSSATDFILEFAPGTYDVNSPVKYRTVSDRSAATMTYNPDLQRSIVLSAGQIKQFSATAYGNPSNTANLPAAMRATGVILRGISWTPDPTPEGFNHLRAGVAYNKAIRAGVAYNKAFRGGVAY